MLAPVRDWSISSAMGWSKVSNGNGGLKWSTSRLAFGRMPASG